MKIQILFGVIHVNGEWVADNVIKYVLENLKLTNPYSAN